METEPKSNVLRILFVSDHLGHDAGRIHGATRYFLDVLPRLHRQKHIALDVVFLREPHDCAQELRAKGVNPTFLSRAKHDPRAVTDLIHLIRKHKIDIVHCAGMKGILAGRMAAGITGAICMDHFHDMIPPTRSIQMLMRATRKRSSHSIAISEAVARFLQTTFHILPDHITCIRNGINTERFTRRPSPEKQSLLRQTWKIPDDATILICLGRLHPLKGQEDAIAALRFLDDPSIWLLMVGDGPDECRLKQAAQHAQVVFTGQRTDIPDLLGIASLLLAPSKSEGLGLGAMEALCAGVPVLAYQQGGLTEIIEHHKNGILIPTGEIESMAQSIRYLLDNQDVRSKMSRYAQQKGQTYSLDHHMEQLTRLYETVKLPPSLRHRDPVAGSQERT